MTEIAVRVGTTNRLWRTATADDIPEVIEWLREQGAGEEAFIEFNADLRAYTVDGAALDDGVYLVLRIEGETR